MLTNDQGSITAEFAVVLPAVLMVLTLVLSSVLLGAHRVTLTSAAAEVARLEARGDFAGAEARLAALRIDYVVQRSREGPLHCATLSSAPAGGLLSAVRLSARGCAIVSELTP